MKKILLILTLTFYSFYLTSRNNVKKYYKFISIAEKSIIETNLIKARKFYKKAFQLETIYFAYDIRNALKVEMELTPDSTQVYWCFKNYVKTGYTNYNKPSKTFKVFFELPCWSSIQLMLDTIKTNFDNELESELSNILISDQSIRSEETLQSYDSNRKDEFDRIDSANVATLLNLYKNHVVNEKTVKSEQLFAVIGLLLNHNRERNNVDELLKIIKQEVLIGNYDARNFAIHYDFRYNYLNAKNRPSEGFYGDDICVATEQFFLFLIPQDNKARKEINKRRKEIYLDDYLIDAQKRMFQYKLHNNPNNNGLNFNFNLSFDYFPPGIEKRFMEHLTNENIKYKIYYKKE